MLEAHEKFLNRPLNSKMNASLLRPICLAIATSLLASCAEPPPPPPPPPVKRAVVKKQTPEDFRAVEKPSTYSGGR